MHHIKNNILAIVLLILSVASIIFAYNDDFLYKNTILKITNIETINKETSTNPLGLIETYYNQKISGKIQNGTEKGKELTVSYEETFSSVVTERYRIGDKVFVVSGSIDGLKRDQYVVLMLSVFIIAIVLVGKFRGLLAIISVALNTVLFYVGLRFYFNGFNLLTLCMLESVLFTVLSLIIAGGWNRKTFSAIISVFCSMTLLLLGSLLIVHQTNYSGISFNGMSFLTVPVEDVFLAELMIGGLGAIMDVAITMSASISELIEKDRTITIAALKKSGEYIGKDIMGTMINVLFFTYFCSGLPVFVLAFRNGFTMHNYITTNFTLEMTRFLVGGIGIILAIPISLKIAIKLLKRGTTHE